MSLNVIACTGERNNLSVFRYGGIHVQSKEPNISTLLAESSFSGMTRKRERETKKGRGRYKPKLGMTKRERERETERD